MDSRKRQPNLEGCVRPERSGRWLAGSSTWATHATAAPMPSTFPTEKRSFSVSRMAMPVANSPASSCNGRACADPRHGPACEAPGAGAEVRRVAAAQ